MFWIVIGLMMAIAVLVVAVPLYRAEKRLTATSISAVIAIAALSAAIYSKIGTPTAQDVHATQADMPAVEEMVSGLAERLQQNPNDLDGWKMLGRSYLQLGNTAGAVDAFQKAVDMESPENGQTLADLGEAVLLNDSNTLTGRAGQLFEHAVTIAPSNPKALFYSGLAAAERGQNELAAGRWEALLATSPPQNIADILRQRIAELRGQPPPVEVPQAAPAAAGGAPVVTVDVSLGPAAAAANLPDATVFVIARDPAQPAPPIAAVRRRLSELPAAVPIGDSDAMIPGRVPSGFDQIEIVARVSLSGQPVAQPGDWFGQKTVSPGTSDSVSIAIDQQVK